MAARQTQRVERIDLNQLVSATSAAVLRALQDQKGRFNPRIWVGIWVDLHGGIGLPEPGVGPVLEGRATGQVTRSKRT